MYELDFTLLKIWEHLKYTLFCNQLKYCDLQHRPLMLYIVACTHNIIPDLLLLSVSFMMRPTVFTINGVSLILYLVSYDTKYIVVTFLVTLLMNELATIIILTFSFFTSFKWQVLEQTFDSILHPNIYVI